MTREQAVIQAVQHALAVGVPDGASFRVALHGLPRDVFDALPGEESEPFGRRPTWSKAVVDHFEAGTHTAVDLTAFTDEPPRPIVRLASVPAPEVVTNRDPGDETDAVPLRPWRPLGGDAA
jgi:hypothetical protein